MGGYHLSFEEIQGQQIAAANTGIAIAQQQIARNGYEKNKILRINHIASIAADFVMKGMSPEKAIKNATAIYIGTEKYVDGGNYDKYEYDEEAVTSHTEDEEYESVHRLPVNKRLSSWRK